MSEPIWRRVTRVIDSKRPVKVRLGKVGHFPGPDYDVVYVEVESVGVHDLHGRLCSLPHTPSEHPFKAHCTIAYVKPGLGAVYALRFGEMGLSAVCDTAVFSDADKTKHIIPLGRTVRVEKAAMSYLDSGSGGALVGPGGMLSSLTKLNRNRRMLTRVCKSYLDEIGAGSLGDAESSNAFDAEEFVFGTKALGAIISKPAPKPAAPKDVAYNMVNPPPMRFPSDPAPAPPPTAKPPKPPDTSSPNEPMQPAAPVAVHPRVKALTEAAAKIPVHDGSIVHHHEAESGKRLPPPEHTLDTWGRDDHGRQSLAFKTGEGNKFVMQVTRRREGDNDEHPIHQVDFHDQNGNFQATGRGGGAHEVFMKVAAASHALLTKTKPPTLYFSAARDGTGANPESRQKLYDTLTKMLASANPDYAALAVNQTGPGGAKSYYVIRRDKLAAMKAHLEKSGKQLETVVKAFDPSEARDVGGKWSKSGISRLPETEDEAIALGTAAREAIVGGDGCKAYNGQCIEAAERMASLHPDMEVWSGIYADGSDEIHKIVKAGDFFIDVTGDQFENGPELAVFTHNDLLNAAANHRGPARYYRNFGPDHHTRTQTEPDAAIVKEMGFYDDAEPLLGRQEKAFNPREPRDGFGKWAKTGRASNPKQPSFLDGIEESEPKKEETPFLETLGQKQCSAVAIRAITGKKVDDVPRTMPQTVFAIEDAGYARDVSPTREWAGKTVDEVSAGLNLPLATVSILGTSEHEAHIMPMVDGKLLNRAGWHDEKVSTVVAFTKKPVDSLSATAYNTGGGNTMNATKVNRFDGIPTKKDHTGRLVPNLPDKFLSEAKWHTTGGEHYWLERLHEDWTEANRKRIEAKERLDGTPADAESEAEPSITRMGPNGMYEFENERNIGWHEAYGMHEAAAEELREVEKEYLPKLKEVLAKMDAEKVPTSVAEPTTVYAKPIAKERIKLKPTGVNEHTVHVDGEPVATVWGHRERVKGVPHANFGITMLDGRKIAEGYSYFKDVVKMLGCHLAEEGGVK